ncbi:hybrid sensor histidine kinase/response regulator [Planktothrix sp. FACHB-1355]|uniref:histidine kinase n=1 Tax=Aerosakkonema funiforme FACHB-1375 TaxID=2949571 RepID=A0A926ZL26_9CYAN|nr:MULTISPECIES: hybrid sensor histidine kinase/response regulator [Oscillatoriales]MBD2185962.1 hybrid sensor histidine kinase/response regulator [Aerosakkonema funiforme FACHB-1375]MBD3561098.1 hybrid sensor histidine kinase/response regulator [Planktothrix sp. FACHB-1355]
MNPEDFNELIGIFIAETQEFLQTMEANLLAMESSSSAEERLQTVKTLFRCAHSIKGSSSIFGFNSLSKAAHCLEDCFVILRDRVDLSELESSTITALLHGLDSLKIIADGVRPDQLNQEIAIAESESSTEPHILAIAQIKTTLEAKYGQKEETANYTINSLVNAEAVKVIFEFELPSVFNQLEAELSQSSAENLPQTIATINNIYYQISGVAGMLQLSYLAEIANQLRDAIDTPNLSVEQLQSSGWKIAQKLQKIRTKVLQGEAIDLQLLEERERVVEQESGRAGENGNNASPISQSPHPPLLPSPISPSNQPTIRVEVERLTELINLVGELVINRTNFELQEAQLRSEAKRIRKSISSLHHFGSELREEYDRLAGEWGTDNGKSEIGKKSNSQSPIAKPHFDILEMDRYTEFHAKAVELIEITQAIAQSASLVDELAVKFERSTDQLRRITDRLRSRVMQLRVVPFSRAVDRLPRALRELCRTFNKDVNLLLLGRDTKIDETLLDALRDPLVHLLRNAFDHGIESPEARIAAGKPASGQIEIEARHQGGQTIITVTDDGRGIDPEGIRSRVVEKGLVAPEQAADLSIAELYEFLFWPGFSTAKEVTDLSGRGVGLDVVRNNLRQVRGTIKVDSRPGRGTSFILKLPLMLSISDALLVMVGKNTIAIPLDAIEEIIHIQPDRIQMAGNQAMLWWEEEFIRLVQLQDLLHYDIPDLSSSAESLPQDSIPAIVLASSEGVVAIAVDRILSQQEIVVKPLPPPISKPRGIVGCTILGDGQVVTILDVDDLLEEFHTHSSMTISVENKSSLGVRTDLLTPPSSLQPQILVVDDSYTIRQLLSQSLTRARYRVAQAKDGQDALSKLEQGIDCSAIIADIEMPRMDGFELLSSLKSHPHFASIPVAMLTSRSGIKYRQLAMELGAVQYFTKPYNEGQLLEAIAKLIKK